MIITNGLILPEYYAPSYIKNRMYSLYKDAYVSVLFKDNNLFNIEKHIQKLYNYSIDIHKEFINKSIIINDCYKLLNINMHKKYGIMYIHTHILHNKLVYTIFMQELTQPKFQYTYGIESCIYKDIRLINSNIKSLNLIGNIYLKKQADKLNIIDPILHRNGFITEAAHSNVFIIKNNVVYTPKNIFILNGTVREDVIDLCKKNNIKIIVADITISQLFKADSIFITNIIEEITPIIKIGNNNFIICNLLKEIQKIYKTTHLY